MKVTLAKFQRRYNVAQYEHEEYTLEAVVEDGDSSIEVIQQLKSDIAAAHAGETGPLEVASTEVKPKKAKKAKKQEPEVSEEDESNEEEIGEEDTAEEDSTTDSDLEEEEEVEVENPKTKVKAKAKKPQPYDRNIEAHKEMFSGVLRQVAPDWKKKDATKAKAKAASTKMAGKPFLDADGEILKDFKLEVKKLMAAK